MGYDDDFLLWDGCEIYKIFVACNQSHVLYVSTFDENLLKHISHELADNDSRKGDTP
jgi:hypothetical protein